MKMNAVDRSDQILSALSTQWKCVRWWKTLFFPLIDIAVVNSFILFQGGKGLNPQSLKPYVFPVSLNRRKTVLCAINGKRPNVQGCQKPDVTEVY